MLHLIEEDLADDALDKWADEGIESLVQLLTTYAAFHAYLLQEGAAE